MMYLSDAKQVLRSLSDRLHDLLPEGRERAESELGQVLLYLIRLANRSGIDLVAAADRCMRQDVERQPRLVPPGDELRPAAALQADAARPLRILIVEDEHIVAADLQQLLNGLGYDAYAIVSSGADALAVARETAPDLVLMDIRIRGLLDGIETAVQMRQRHGTAIIFLTAHADDATVERAKQSDPYGYLIKPVNAAALKTTIELTSYRHRHV
jgi:CheY-like chemotaxis protein